MWRPRAAAAKSQHVHAGVQHSWLKHQHDSTFELMDISSHIISLTEQ